jgi:hypothetical protein
MKHKDINKKANDFANALLTMMGDLQKNILNVSEKDAKELGIDLNSLNKEAEEKVKELKATLTSFENKIKNL